MLRFFQRENRRTPVSSWWSDALTPKERAILIAEFKPLASIPGSISAESLALSTDPSVVAGLVGYVKKEHLRHLGYKILKHTDSLLSETTPVLSMHFYWHIRGGFFYRWRDLDDFALSEAEYSYKRQVDLSPKSRSAFLADETLGFLPAHSGYRQLRIIEEKRGNFKLARALCDQARAEGWADDWDRHISRLSKKAGDLR